MAIMQWCGAAARQMMRTQCPAVLAASSVSGISGAANAASASMEVCGRGDKKTKKGKRFKGSYGNARMKKKKMIERIKDKNEIPRSTPWPLPFKLI